MKRRFSCYGPVNTRLHYYVPRTELVKSIYNKLTGNLSATDVEDFSGEGEYFTVWAPRQTGKTWALNQVLKILDKNQDFDIVKIELQLPDIRSNSLKIANYIIEYMNEHLGFSLGRITSLKEFQNIFTKKSISKPLILILDEFDCLTSEVIGDLVGVFRNIFLERAKDEKLRFTEKSYLLHGVALIGVRSVLGVDNVKGSPFNVQRSVNIPNLTFSEVRSMFSDYSKEHNQKVDEEVIKTLYRETNGQPGLVSWFGEILTEKNNPGDNWIGCSWRECG